MEFSHFVRKPFVVEAIEVTSENLQEVAKLIGEVKTEPDTNRLYIHVNKNKVPNIPKVYPGYWVTKMGKKIRVYSHNVFTEQFSESNPIFEAWMKMINDAKPIDNSTEAEVASG